MKKFLIFVLILIGVLTTLMAEEKKMAKQTVVFETTKGKITLEVYPEVAPKTVENFVGLVNKGYYNGVIFHRVINNFMIQGGDPTGTGRGGECLWGEKFEDEISAKALGLDKMILKEHSYAVGYMPESRYKDYLDKSLEEFYTSLGYTYKDELPSMKCEYGTICMANAGPNTNGSQFFIVDRKDGCSWLNGKHTVFGKVVDGMDVVEAISEVKVAPQSNKPYEDMVIKKAYEVK